MILCFSQTIDHGALDKSRLSTSGELSPALENGRINSPNRKVPNLIIFDETKRPNGQPTDGIASQSQYGKTLNVPNPNAIHALPIATPVAPVAPKAPPRPAIMTTPKSSTMTPKSASLALSSPDTRPLLVVTTTNDQQKPKTIAVPNGRRLPINGRISTVSATQQRQQPPPPIANRNHQIISETMPKKIVNSKPRAALFFTTTRTRKNTFLFILTINFF